MQTVQRNISGIFSEVAYGLRPPFRSALSYMLGSNHAAGKILTALRALQIEIPDENREFMTTTEGVMILSSRYGVVTRIETKNFAYKQTARIDDNPFVLQPIASFDVGPAVISICPGVHALDRDDTAMAFLQPTLKTLGVNLWDDGAGNIGLLPFKTPRFPEGVPVVLDILAVGKLSEATATVRDALDAAGLTQDPQQSLYAPLRKLIAEAWPEGAGQPDPFKMTAFWRAVSQARRHGILVPGWDEGSDEVYKKADARDAALFYDSKLRKKWMPRGTRGNSPAAP